MSCVPWLRKLNAVISTTAKMTSGQCAASVRNTDIASCLLGLPRGPGRRFRHAACGDTTRAAPARRRAHNMPRQPMVSKQQVVDDRGDEVAGRDSLPAAGRRRRRASSGGTLSITSDAPMPHSPPIAMPNSARRMISVVRFGAKRRRKLKHRKQQHVDHQDRAAAIAVRQPAEDEGADRPHRQRHQDRQRHIGDARLEIRRDGVNDEDQDEIVEGVEHPAEEAGDEGIAGAGRKGLEGGEAGEHRECPGSIWLTNLPQSSGFHPSPARR